MEMTLSPLPDIGEVTRQLSRHDEKRVDANVLALPGIARSELLSGNGHAPKAIFIQRPGSSVSRAALLDLDEGNDPAAAGDKINFTARDTDAPGKDPPAL